MWNIVIHLHMIETILESLGIFSMPKSMEDYKWEVETYFTKKEEFVEAIRTYGVHNGRKLKIFRNDK